MYLKHGLSNTPEYKCWQQLKARCLNPNHRAYPDYGGRGITVHESWGDDFMAFLEHVGQRPSPKHSLDRIDNDRGYEPGNVRWVTEGRQNTNRRPHREHGERRQRPLRADGKPTNYKHGMIHTPEYKAWAAMKDRCLNLRSNNYPNWGGRGITVCHEWAVDFMAFYRDVGPRPSPQHSLDRINNDGSYEIGNVRWGTKRQQSQNRRPCKTGPDHGNATHGRGQTPEYRTWASIKTRCFNPKHDRYASYGGRGITMCQRWRESFEAFLADLGPKPEKHTVLRLDSEGHYSCGGCPECQENRWPANCRWATRTEINRRRRSIKLTRAKAEDIRQRLAAGASDGAVAQDFGVASSLVGKIRRGESWA